MEGDLFTLAKVMTPRNPPAEAKRTLTSYLIGELKPPCPSQPGGHPSATLDQSEEAKPALNFHIELIATLGAFHVGIIVRQK